MMKLIFTKAVNHIKKDMISKDEKSMKLCVNCKFYRLNNNESKCRYCGWSGMDQLVKETFEDIIKKDVESEQ